MGKFFYKAQYLALLLTIFFSTANGQVPDRRKDQFPTDFAYLIFPAPYSLPGIGHGIFVIGYLANTFESPADIYAYKLTGDVTGQGFGIDELPIVSRNLLLQVFRQDISNAQVNQYFSRGMESKKDDYYLVDASDVAHRIGILNLNLFERRLELHYTYSTVGVKLDSTRDSKGAILQTYNPSLESKSKDRTASIILDLTDDYYDPRVGLRVFYDRGLPHARESLSDPDFRVDNLVMNGYIPMGKANTLAMNYFRSKSIVSDMGEVDPTVINEKYCGPTPTQACLAASQPLIDAELAHNRYGTAMSLGGQNRLRAYPDGRFKGAQVEYIGLEFRWNYSEQVTPFNYWIWKDTRTGLQMAFIAEAGSVAETPDQLWDRSRKDAGVGFRMVTASGAVYRADLMWGDEGFAPLIIVSYPW